MTMRPIALLALALTACATHGYVYASSLPTAAEPRVRGATCAFQIVDILPAGDFEEIGIVTYDANAGPLARNLDEFRRFIAADVCPNHGTIVRAEQNGRGAYARAVVYREREATPPAAETNDPQPPLPPDSP